MDLKRTPDALKAFGMSGNAASDMDSARAFLFELYGKLKKFPCSTLDKLRNVLASITDRSATQLLPTEDAFEHHVKRHDTSVDECF